MVGNKLVKDKLEKYSFFGFSISKFSKIDLVDYIETSVNHNKKKIIYGYGLGIFMLIKKHTNLYKYSEHSDVLVTDGRILYILAKIVRYTLKV